MDFNLDTNNATFEQIKDWFGMHWGELPITLDGKHKYYGSVTKSVEMNIDRVTADLELNNGKPNRMARLHKASLVELYNDLQVLENWNEPMKLMAPDKFRI
ncbi:MAG: hypothetical protein ACI9N9_000053 [Enterobacterales bacterium]|jgi:hypothetical protein